MSQETHPVHTFQALQQEAEQMAKEIKKIQQKLPGMVAPGYRMNAQNRLRSLQAQHKIKRQALRPIGLKLRQQHLKSALENWIALQKEMSPEAFIARLLTDNLEPVIKALTHPPYGGTAWEVPLKHLQQGHQTLLEAWRNSGPLPKKHLDTLRKWQMPEKANAQEKSLLKRYVMLLEKSCVKAFPGATLSPDQTMTNQVMTSQSRTKKAIPTKRSYNDALIEGMGHIKSAFSKIPPPIIMIKAGIDILTEAVKLNPSGFEAYFSLGYTFAQLGDQQRAVQFLEKAYTMSRRKDILKFLEQVKSYQK